MLDSVKSNLLGFLGRFEGRGVTWPYIDTLGYVTTGIGYLANSLDALQKLPWMVNGSPADPAQVADAWNALVKLRTQEVGQKQTGSIAMNGGASAEMQAVTNIRLSQADVDKLAMDRALDFEKTLKTYFPAWEQFPADGQMLLLSMAWAMGPAFAKGYPNFTKAVNNADFRSAATEATWKYENQDRKAADDLLAQNAANVLSAGGNLATLYWPSAFSKTAIVGGGSGLIAAVVLGAGYLIYRIIKS